MSEKSLRPEVKGLGEYGVWAYEHLESENPALLESLRKEGRLRKYLENAVSGVQVSLQNLLDQGWDPADARAEALRTWVFPPLKEQSEESEEEQPGEPALL